MAQPLIPSQCPDPLLHPPPQAGEERSGAPRRQERKKSFLDYATKPTDAAGRKPGKIRPTSLCPKWRTKTSLHTVR